MNALMLANSLVSTGGTLADADMTYLQKYMGGTDTTALHNFKARLDRGEDAACGFVGDSTFADGAALPVQFANALAGKYPNAQVELRRAGQSDPWAITTTVVQAGASGRRHRYFGTGATYGLQMPAAMLRASMSGVTEISFEVEVALDAALLTNGVPNTEVQMIGCGSTGSKTVFYLGSNGYIVLQVEVSSGVSINVVSSIPLPAATMTAGVPLKFRVDFNANNGSNRTGKFYTAPAGSTTWTQFGTTISSTTTTFYTGEAFYWIASAGSTATDGVRFYHAQMLIGSTRDPVFPYRIDQWIYGAGQITGMSSMGGSQTIYIDDFSQNGATLGTNGFFTGSGSGDFATEAYRSFLDHAPDFVIINSKHNDTGMSAPAWETNMDAAVTNILARFAYDPIIVHTTQNPQPLDVEVGDGLSFQHNRSQPDVMAYAAKKGRGCTDIYRAFVDANNPAYEIAGNVHPSEAGYEFWGRTFFRLFQSS